MGRYSDHRYLLGALAGLSLGAVAAAAGVASGWYYGKLAALLYTRQVARDLRARRR